MDKIDMDWNQSNGRYRLRLNSLYLEQTITNNIRKNLLFLYLFENMLESDFVDF